MKRTLGLLAALLAACTTPQEKFPLSLSRLPAHREQQPLNRYEQGIEAIAADKDWQDLHEFLHRVTSPESLMKLEVTEQQQRYLTDYASFQQFQRGQEMHLLDRVLSQPGHPQELALADLIFLSEVHESLRAYVDGAHFLPKPRYDLTTLFHLRYPKSTNTLQRIP